MQWKEVKHAMPLEASQVAITYGYHCSLNIITRSAFSLSPAPNAMNLNNGYNQQAELVSCRSSQALSSLAVITASYHLLTSRAHRLSRDAAPALVPISAVSAHARATALSAMTVSNASTLSSNTTRAARCVRRIKRCTTPGTTLMSTPASLSRPQRIVEAIEGSIAVGEWEMARERDVVEPEVPDGGVDHAVSAERHDCTDDGSGNNVVVVVELIDSECASYQDCGEDGHVGHYLLLANGRGECSLELDVPMSFQYAGW